ncbi:hypothetical protein [Neobacillus sp. DY30]|nr:hypothetical protein [Neobacillus sp. DY30]WHX98195.1 hypothetical protein QNH29_16155 [Neobacillus sp. DY30]
MNRPDLSAITPMYFTLHLHIPTFKKNKYVDELYSARKINIYELNDQ